MGGAVSERGKLAGVAFGHLQRTVRFYRLYPHEHPFCVDAKADTFAALGEFHREHGPLEVEVGFDGFYLDEELVLAGDDTSGALVGLFYYEAIRELLIDIGIPEEELTRLVEILSAPYPEGNKDAFADDLTTALWREDLQYFGYQTHDPLAAGIVRDSNQGGVMGALLARIRGLVDSLGGSLEAPKPEEEERKPEGLDSDAFLAELAEAEAQGELDDKADWATHPDKAIHYMESEKGRERKRLVDEMGKLEADDEVNRAAEVVAWSVNVSHPGVRVEDAARFLSGSALYALSNGDLEQATRLVGVASQADGGRGVVAPLVATRLSSAEGIQALAKTLTKRAGRLTNKQLTQLGVSYLNDLDQRAVEGTCAAYGEVEDARVRKVLREYLSSNLDLSAASLAPLARHPDSVIANEAVELLGSHGKDSAGFQTLLSLSKQQVGLATNKVLEMTGERERRKRSKAVRESAERGTRMNAIAGLADNPSKRTYKELGDLLEGEALFGRDAEELSATFYLLYLCDPERAGPALSKVAQRKVPMLRGRADVQRLKDAASECLQRMRGTQ